jgi:hypothetical protein
MRILPAVITTITHRALDQKLPWQPVHYERVLKKNIGRSLARLFGLPQAEIAGNEKHYHHNTNNVENIVHVSSSFLSRIGLPWSQMPITFSERASERPSVVVLPSDAAP